MHGRSIYLVIHFFPVLDIHPRTIKGLRILPFLRYDRCLRR
jgi:hypothetical protein